MLRSLSLLFVVIGSAVGYFHGVDPNTLKCDPTGKTSLLLPHGTECNKFYMCAHGEEVEFTCPPTTIFDFPIQTCNWPWATKCWLRNETDDIEGSGEEEFTPESEAIRFRPASTETMMSARLDCHNLDTSSRRVGFKGDCQRYWSCSAGSPRASYCSDGLFFNEEKQQCDFEANVKGDCQRYWSCSAGSPRASYCSDGLFFNEEKQQCDFEANVKCVDENVDELHTEFIEYN